MSSKQISALKRSFTVDQICTAYLTIQKELEKLKTKLIIRNTMVGMLLIILICVTQIG